MDHNNSNGNPTLCYGRIVLGEVAPLILAIKKVTQRWSSSQQSNENDPLVQQLRELQIKIIHLKSDEYLDPCIFLEPFLAVIRSEDTSGPVTKNSLAAVNRILNYGLIECSHSNAAAAVESIATAVTHARFVGTDQGADEVVLWEILTVLRTLMLGPVGYLLTNESVCEILNSSFRICFETRLSELLRNCAEDALRHMIQLLFARLPQFKDDPEDIKKMKMKANIGSCSKYTKSSPSKLSVIMKQDIIQSESPCVKDLNDGVSTMVNISVEKNNAITSSTEDIAQKSVVQTSYQDAEPSTSNFIDAEKSDSTDVVLPIQPLDISHTHLASDCSESCETTTVSDVYLISDEDVKSQIIKGNDCPGPGGESEHSLFSKRNSQEKFYLAEKEDYINLQGVKFTQDLIRNEKSRLPYGLPSVRESLRFLISITLSTNEQNTPNMIHTALNLLTVALEVGIDHVNHFPSLIKLIRNQLCRNLLLIIKPETKLHIFMASLRVCLLLFESLRTQLKFQLEMFITKLTNIVTSESSGVSYYYKELALEAIVQLWRMPSFITELFLNFDCNLYSSNVFEDLTKILAKNSFPFQGLFSTNVLSLEALLTAIDIIGTHNLTVQQESQTSDKLDSKHEQLDSYKLDYKSNYIVGLGLLYGCIPLQPHFRARLSITGAEEISREYLLAVKEKKKLLRHGSEIFNTKPEKGIQFLQDNSILGKTYEDIALFLRDNPHLDKKVIGEFVSKKKNVAVLSAFVKSFNFKSLRIDECLRMFLESFRLPGEAPLISIIIEHFSSHWHLSNGEPFEKEDAAFTLAYAVIMLNVDQHNQNAKKQNIPMTLNQFTNNLRGVNNGKDFDRKMLEEIYNAIHNEEIVMPAEQSGLVKENYLWKLLLKRGNSKEGKYFVARIDDYKFDKDLFALCWGPSIASLSFVFDKCTDESLVKKAVAGFEKCATISARYGMTDVFDNLIISLCKFTMLTSSSESPDQISISFGFNPKAQLSATTVFSLVILHGDMLREAWRNVIELLLQFFKLRLLPIPMIESEDFVHPSGKVSLISVSPSNIPRTESGIFSSLYSYIALGDSGSSKGLSEEDLEAMERAKTCVLKCHPEKIITESAFLRYDSLCELLKTVMSAGDTNFMIDQNPISPTVKSLSPKNQESTHTALDEYGQAFLLELVVSILVANKDRAGGVWPSIRDHIYSLLMSAVALNKHFLLERCIVAVLKVAKVLLRRPELANPILQSLRMLLLLRSHVLNKAAVQVVSGIYEVLSVNADHILDSNDWAILFALLECCGAGAKPPPIVNVDRSYVDDFSQRSAASDSETAGSLVDSGNSTDTSNTLTEKEDHGVSSKFDDENKVFDQATLPELFSGQFGPFSSRPSRSTSPETIQNAGGWILVGKEGEIEPVPVKPISFNQYDIVHQRILEQHNPEALLKSVETVSFLVRERHITSSSLPSVVQACRTLVEATLNGGKSEKRLKSRESSRPPSERRTHATRRKDDRSNVSAKKAVPRNAGAAHFEYDADESDADDSPISYHRMSEKILDLMDSLHSNSSHILNMSSDEGVCRQPPLGHFVSLWNQALCPLLQGMARYCCDSRNTIRNLAMTYLQRALLNHDLQSLSATEWEGCFNKVLFPLLSKLLLPIDEGNHNAMEETRVRAATLVQKVYLRHLTSLMCLPTFTALWLTILDFMDKYLNTHRSDHLNDAIPEILKNMLLVMETTQVFHTSEGFTHLWSVTWDRIDSFLPAFRNELFKSHPPSEIHRVDLQVSSTALNHQSDNTSSRTVVLSKATGGATAELDLQMGDTHQLEDYSAASSFEESGDNVHNYSSALSSDYKEKSLSQEAADNNKTYSLSGQNAIRLSLSQEDLASCISSNIILGPPLPYVTPIPSDSSSVAGQNSASSCPNVSISSCDHVKPTVCASPPLASILFKKSNPGDPFDSMVNPSAPVKVEASDCDSVTVKIFKEN